MGMYIYIPLYLLFWGLMSTNCDLCTEFSKISLSGNFCRSQAENRVTFLQPQSFKHPLSSLTTGCSPKKAAFHLSPPLVKLTCSTEIAGDVTCGV